MGTPFRDRKSHWLIGDRPACRVLRPTHAALVPELVTCLECRKFLVRHPGGYQLPRGMPGVVVLCSELNGLDSSVPVVGGNNGGVTPCMGPVPIESGRVPAPESRTATLLDAVAPSMWLARVMSDTERRVAHSRATREAWQAYEDARRARAVLRLVGSREGAQEAFDAKNNSQ